MDQEIDFLRGFLRGSGDAAGLAAAEGFTAAGALAAAAGDVVTVGGAVAAGDVDAAGDVVAAAVVGDVVAAGDIVVAAAAGATFGTTGRVSKNAAAAANSSAALMAARRFSSAGDAVAVGGDVHSFCAEEAVADCDGESFCNQKTLRAFESRHWNHLICRRISMLYLLVVPLLGYIARVFSIRNVDIGAAIICTFEATRTHW